MKKLCRTLDDTRQLAQNFAALVKNGVFVSLYGEIGAGKTAFVKLVAEALGVKEKVTSPSFVILNEYHTGSIPVYHFDLYRLEGVNSIEDELREYSGGKQLTFVEWAEFLQVPFSDIKINVTYDDDDARVYEFEGGGYDYSCL
jgi:tRNA threonylcarbamoyladenosine biosynthesis protein TsaE